MARFTLRSTSPRWIAKWASPSSADSSASAESPLLCSFTSSASSPVSGGVPPMAVTTSPSWTSSAFTFEIGVRRLRARIRGGVDQRRAGDEAEPGRIDPQHAVLERQIHLAPADRQPGPLDLAELDVERQIHRIQRAERCAERGQGAPFGFRTLRPEAEIGQIEGRDRQLARDPRPGALVLYGEILVDHGPADPRFARQPPPGTLAGQPAGVRQRTEARDVGVQHSADDGAVPRLGIEAEVDPSDRRRRPQPDLRRCRRSRRCAGDLPCRPGAADP